MADTTNIQFHLLEGMQAQKHITVNETLQKLDILLFLTVQSRTITTPPVSPSDGQSWIIPASGATGDWTGRGTQIAARQDGAWFYLIPRTGFRAWVVSDSRQIHFNGTTWDNTLGHITATSLALTPSSVPTATAGGGATLPATTAGFMAVNVAGANYKIPLYL